MMEDVDKLRKFQGDLVESTVCTFEIAPVTELEETVNALDDLIGQSRGMVRPVLLVFRNNGDEIRRWKG